MSNPYLRLLILSVAISSWLPVFVVVTAILLLKPQDPSSLLEAGAGLAAAALLVSAGIIVAARRFGGMASDVFARQGELLDSLPDHYTAWAIIGTASLSLFLELVVIRWLGTVYPFFAFYKNFTLLACFGGLGVGYAMSRQNYITLPLVVPFVAWYFLILLGVRYGLADYMNFLVMGIPFTEQVHIGVTEGNWINSLYFASSHVFLAVVFVMTSLIFVPIGQLCGRLMERTTKLRAYGLNLIGSILGVLLAFGTGYLWLPPVAWFAIAFGAILCTQVFSKTATVAAAGSAVLALVILSVPITPGHQQIYSPYQLIETSTNKWGWLRLEAAGHYHQEVYDFSLDTGSRANGLLSATKVFYEIPYTVNKNPCRVAVLGAGSGNDVAAALRSGAKRVDAVEIDPVIVNLGRAHHPERPYQSRRVHSIINDARIFLRTAQDKYDVVTYGLLDSHILLGGASNVRLDSFVYTIEGFREARSLLNEGGVVAVSFWVANPILGGKLFRMMQAAFDGREPLCLGSGLGKIVTFLQGRDGPVTLDAQTMKKYGFKDFTAYYRYQSTKSAPSTDDWPFFYMTQKKFPFSYFPMAIMVVLLSWMISRQLLGTSSILGRGNLVFFFLGAAFMLIETKTITELGLSFGNTWHLIGIAIIGILIMAYLANLVVDRLHVSSILVPYLLLFCTLYIGYTVMTHGGLPVTAWGKIWTCVILTCPIFFSGMIFSYSLQVGGNISEAMTANLLGAICGGLLEYLSMCLGFAALGLLAMALYGMSLAAGTVWRSTARSSL